MINLKNIADFRYLSALCVLILANGCYNKEKAEKLSVLQDGVMSLFFDDPLGKSPIVAAEVVLRKKRKVFSSADSLRRILKDKAVFGTSRILLGDLSRKSKVGVLRVSSGEISAEFDIEEVLGKPGLYFIDLNGRVASDNLPIWFYDPNEDLNRALIDFR